MSVSRRTRMRRKAQRHSHCRAVHAGILPAPRLTTFYKWVSRDSVLGLMKVAFTLTVGTVVALLRGFPKTTKRQLDTFKRWNTGYPVRVRKSHRAPMAGHCGKIVAVDPSDPYGAYLVRFANGFQFRYRESEIHSVDVRGAGVPATRIINS